MARNDIDGIGHWLQEAFADGGQGLRRLLEAVAQAAFRQRRLDHASWPYLMVDARYEKVRVDGKVVSQAVLVVIGFTGDGRREILDWRVGDSESEQCWGEVFRTLKDRGLAGVKLVISDAHRGIR